MSMTQTQSALELTTAPAHVHQSKEHPRPPQQQSNVSDDNPALRKGPTAAIFFSITGVNMISAMLNGIVTVALPVMVRDLGIPPALMYWPASIYALTCGCSLILSGAVADLIGSRFMYILGAGLQSAFTLGCGLAQTTIQMIFLRALAGVAIAFCLPAAVSLITTYFPHGKRRNLAFAAMGGGQPLGFATGLVLGGLLSDSPATWRGGFYIGAGLNTIVLIVTFFGLPKIQREQPLSWQSLWDDIDWTGAMLLSASLGTISYVFAALTGSVTTIRQPTTIALLSLSMVLFASFVFWVGRQERLGRPAIIPNSLWRNQVFTSICISVFVLWGAFNALETLMTFFFQDVQRLSATQASIRFLPTALVGAAVNASIGLVIHRLRANYAIIVSASVSCIPPILAAMMQPSDSYWEFAFPAVALMPVAVDVLFTASNLVITSAFPDNTQALAGGVFNTIAQIGKSVGLALTAVIANSISLRMEGSGKSHELVLLEGYKGAFWFCLGLTASVIVVSLLGLRNIGRLGVKRE